MRRRGRRRRRVMSGVELEAYQTLRRSLELTMPRDRQPHVILVTGALHAEGKTTATARLGRSLAQAGHRVLLRLGRPARAEAARDVRPAARRRPGRHARGARLGHEDLRRGMLMARATHEVMARSTGAGAPRRAARDHERHEGEGPRPPDRRAGHDGASSSRRARSCDYDYVLVDAPPLLGIADSQALARYVDEVLLVNRLDRLTLEHVDELRDVLDRLERPAARHRRDRRARRDLAVLPQPDRPPLVEEQEAPSSDAASRRPRSARRPTRGGASARCRRRTS